MERFQADKPGVGRDASAELVGPYVLLAEIGRGELATIHLAKKQGALGFQRLYALKRLRPGLAGSLEHVELLLDEARLGSSIHHSNITDVLDVGTDAGSYVVMEYVEGESLEGLLSRAGAARHPRYVVPALVDTLHGLHALHGAADDGGASSGIVHQAPRARHVLLGVDGTARLVDFSQVRAHHVRPSRVRSERLKVAYMAPEQALHPDGVDSRADLFVVGITLWEALTGERLFAGDNDEQTFQNMLHRRIPRPSEVGLKPPRCFDAICMRALERDRSKRYASALEMARDLRDTALNEALYATSAELGQWVREIAGAELRERRRRSGIETPSSPGIPLETPTLGFDRNALVRGKESAPAAAEPTASAVRASPGMEENPYTTGRIHGGSQASLREAAETPALGMRRAPLPREEPSDDQPTGRRSSVPESARPGLRSPAPGTHSDDVARAATLPVLATPESARPTLGRAKPAEPQESSSSARDQDRTQPNVFVPSRPGARRDAKVASPGAYLQVDARRGRSGGADQSATAAGSNFDEVATTTHPAMLGRAGATGERSPAGLDRAATPATGLHRNRISPLPSRRSITEAPPTYVQRRDSNPTRMQIPDGPVGAPHRSFPVDDVSAELHHPDEAAPEPSHSRVRAADIRASLRAELADSLSPSMAASLTSPPEPPVESMGRSWAMWLASGVLVAIILLAVGVGVRQWIAGPARVLPSTRHTASGEGRAGAPSRPPAGERAAPAQALPALEQPAPAQPQRALELPTEIVVPADSAPRGPLQLGSPGRGAAPRRGASAARRGGAEPAPARRLPAEPAAAPLKRAKPAPSPKPVGVPENPY